MGTVPAHPYFGLTVKRHFSFKKLKSSCITTQHALSRMSSADEIFLCCVEMGDGEVSTNKAADSEVVWIGLHCKELQAVSPSRRVEASCSYALMAHAHQRVVKQWRNKQRFQY